MDGRSAAYKPGAPGFAKIRGNPPQQNQAAGSGPRGLEKVGGQRAPTSSGRRTAYGATLQSMYGKTPSQTSTPRALDKRDIGLAGTREAHRIGKR
jgi:hypothetical protein